ncbi:Uncharacterized protein SCF082_LOCUS33001, partial [Durusdinium trenchii]
FLRPPLTAVIDMVILVRETGCCHGCWALFRGPSGKSNEGHHAVVVQESAELTEQTQPVEPLLSLEARIAARQDDAESLELLTSVLRRSIRGLDEQGRSLLFYAVRGNRDDGGKAQASAAAVAKKLLGDAAQWDEVPRYLVKRHHFDVNFQAQKTGFTPLMEATRFGNLFGVELLLELRADVNLQSVRGETALDVARGKVLEHLDLKEMQCSENRLEMVKDRVESDKLRIADLLRNA